MNRCKNRFWQKLSWPASARQMPAKSTLVRLSLLSGLVFIAGCEGSQLGDRVGKSLEPDPQLADNPNGLAIRQDSDNNRDTNASAAAENDPAAGDTEETENQPSVTERNQPTTDTNEDSGQPTAASPEVAAGDYTDLGKAPEEIQPYLVDLIELDLLEVRPPAKPPAANGDGTPATAAPAPGPDEFRPNQAVTRREYARWLLATNNQFYSGDRTRKIRPGVTSAQPVFQDVPAGDADFAAIQGLAEAGIIPSPLTGSSTTVTFRPDAPLTRKDLLTWKVPLDTRQPLPDASISAVQQAWGFQDAEKIPPRSLQAVLADYQNGDFSNFRRAFSYTTLFQPDKAATRAEAAAVLWRFGNPAEGITAAEVRGVNNGAGGDAGAADSEEETNDNG
ncbi:MAG: S-layer homology domain-containing protein [Cyanobacteria bacterium J06614_10]